MVLPLLAAAWAAPLTACGQTYDNGALQAAIDTADKAVAKLDVATLIATRNSLLERVACAREPLPPAIIGGVHRVVATAASVEHQEVRIAPALASMMAADPGYQLPVELYSPSNAVRLSLAHASLLLREGLPRPLRTPSAGWVEVEGASAQSMSTTRPSVVQYFDGAGAVLESRYLWPEDPLGDWEPVAALNVAATQPGRAPLPLAAGSAPPPHRMPLIVATATSVLATGLLYGVAAADRGAFDDRTVGRSEAELSALRDETNGLTVGWIVAGAASLGLGATVAITW
jgi:hypothetical protein